MELQLDIDIGRPGDPAGPIRRAFELRGLRMPGTTIRQLREGKRGPAHTAYRLACADRLRANDASRKNEFLLRLIRAGLAYRYERTRLSLTTVYSPRGIVAAMGDAGGCSQAEMRRIVRVMRADVGIEITYRWDDDFVKRFRSAAAKFLRVHRNINIHVVNLRDARTTNDYVNSAWDKHTIHGFYFALNQLAHSAGQAIWLPYELELLRYFYEKQHEYGSSLTHLDRQALAGAVTGDPTAKVLCAMVRAALGSVYPPHCVTLHRRLLAIGSAQRVLAARSPRR